MPKYRTWSQLPAEIRDLDPEDRDALLAAEGIQIIPDAYKPPDPILTRKETPQARYEAEGMPRAAASQMRMIAPGMNPGEPPTGMGKFLAGAGSTAAGMALGGAGAIPIGVGALLSGSLNAKYGPEPTSGQGIADMALNVASGPLSKITQLGPKTPAFLNFLKNGLMGGAQVAGGQMLGNTIAEAKGEPVNPLTGGQILAGGAAGALVPAIFGRLAQALQNTTPALREKVQPLLAKIMGEEAPDPAKFRSVIADLEAGREASNALKRKVIPISSPAGAVPVVPPVSSQPSVNASAPMPAPPRAVPAAGDDLEELLRKSLANARAGRQMPPMAASVPSEPAPPEIPEEDIAAVMARLRPALGKSIPAAAVPPVPETPAVPAQSPAYQPLAAALNDPKVTAWRNLAPDEKKFFAKVRDTGPEQFFARIIDDPKEFGKLPEYISRLSTIFPESDVRKQIQTDIVGRMLSGIGPAGSTEPFGDLSMVQRVKEMAGKTFGDKKGRDVINEIFQSPDAARNIEYIHDILEHSIESAGKGAKWKMFINKTSPVLGYGTALGTIYIPILGAAALPLGGAAGAASTYKAISLTAETIADMVSKRNTKWARVLLDMARGGEAHSAATINQVISGLRRRGEERTLTEEEAQREMEALSGNQD